MADRWLAQQASNVNNRYPAPGGAPEEDQQLVALAKPKQSKDPKIHNRNRVDDKSEKHLFSRNERLYEAYNDLHALAQDFKKPFDAPAILVVGHQVPLRSCCQTARWNAGCNIRAPRTPASPCPCIGSGLHACRPWLQERSPWRCAASAASCLQAHTKCRDLQAKCASHKYQLASHRNHQAPRMHQQASHTNTSRQQCSTPRCTAMPHSTSSPPPPPTPQHNTCA